MILSSVPHNSILIHQVLSFRYHESVSAVSGCARTL